MKRIIVLIGVLFFSLNAFASPYCEVDGKEVPFVKVDEGDHFPTLFEIAQIDDDLYITSKNILFFGIGHIVFLSSKSYGKVLDILVKNNRFSNDVTANRVEHKGYVIECEFEREQQGS